jgi:ABC-type uncharacterized transport system involved in gliding motility auxiliary subunit
VTFLAAAALVMVLSGLASYYTTGEVSVFSAVNVVAGALLLVTSGVLQSRRVAGFSGARSRSVLLRWSAVCGAVLVAVVLLNVLASRWSAALDLTADRQYTLSDQTHTVCAQIGTLPEAQRPTLLFFEDALIAKDVALRIAQYRAHCPIEIRDLQRDEAPPAARAILIEYETTVVACRSGYCEAAGYPSEGNITNALLRMTRQTVPIVYFVFGHGEVNLRSEGNHGFAYLSAALHEEGFEVRGYVGPARADVPPDADVIVLAAPERDLLPAEAAGLERYLAEGGRLLALLEPESPQGLVELLERWGFGLPQGVVADDRVSPLIADPAPLSLLVNRFSGWHPITRKLSSRQMVLLPSTRPVLPARKPEPGDRLEALVYSHDSSWLVEDVAAARGGQVGRGGRRTSLPLAAAGLYPREAGETRIVVIGDSDFASNRLLNTLYNPDLIINALLWLAQDEEQIALRPKGPTPDQDPLTIEQTLAYFYFLAFALPEALLLMGIYAWHRQRG